MSLPGRQGPRSGPSGSLGGYRSAQHEVTPVGIAERFKALKADQPHLQLCALIDGLTFERLQGERLQAGPGLAALFDGTDDAALAFAGPWLVDAAQQHELCERLLAQEALAPLVSWLITSVPFDGLAQLLRLKLDVRMPDGSIGLLRFHDPRVLFNLAKTLTAPQREAFFGHIDEWHFMHNGHALRIGRADA